MIYGILRGGRGTTVTITEHNMCATIKFLGLQLSTIILIVFEDKRRTQAKLELRLTLMITTTEQY